MTGSIPPPFPLAYEGQVAVPYINRTFDPNSSNNTFPVPTLWINTSASLAWLCVSKPSGVANWLAIGGGATQVETLTGNSGGAVPPTGGNINILGDTKTINVVGDPSTSTLTISATGSIPKEFDTDAGIAVPALNVLTITGSATGLTTTGAGSTVGMTGTLVVGHGGTGIATTTAYGVICGGTTATNPFQNAGAGTAGQVLTSNGAAALPSFQALPTDQGFTSIVQQVFTTSGTYTPTAGMKYCIVEAVGGGGGGAGCPNAAANQDSVGGGGGAGGFSRLVASSATIGVSQVVTIGALGAGGAAGQNDGFPGGNTSLGALISCIGGGGGISSISTTAPSTSGGAGGTASGGSINANGNAGTSGFGINTTGVNISLGGIGGGSYFGGSPLQVFTSNATSFAGNNANGYGSGGGGACANNGGGQQAGGNGSSGIIVVTEYIS